MDNKTLYYLTTRINESSESKKLYQALEDFVSVADAARDALEQVIDIGDLLDEDEDFPYTELYILLQDDRIILGD